MEHPALQLKNISFKYPGQQEDCLSSINLLIHKGERFGLFGPNGAGKTSLISILAGLFVQHSGTILWDGAESKSTFSKITSVGFVPQELAFYSELTPLENFSFFGSMLGLSATEIKNNGLELLTRFGLAEVANKQVRFFSGGMKRRVNLAIGVLHKPSILFLDEPTVGVDVQSRKAILDYLRELSGSGTTLVYTSHHMKEAEELCNHIALIENGKIIADSTPKNLISEHGESTLEGVFIKLTGKEYRD